MNVLPAKRTAEYTNESIKTLKGADRVRKRPAVIFGSDGLDGCEHAFFEILSNSLDEAREGHGTKIVVTKYQDGSVEVEDFGRGCPVDYNSKEGRYNWELVFCEMYGGGKYDNNDGGNYEYSLGLNGLGLCATQYSSAWMEAEIYRDGFKYNLQFKKGNIDGEMQKVPADRKATGSRFHWLPDLDVFTDIAIPTEYFTDTLKRQAVVNPGVKFIFRNQNNRGFETTEYLYPNGITDYVSELVGDQAITSIQTWNTQRSGRDRDDLPEYKVRISAALCFTNTRPRTEYYHNSSWLEYGGSPERAVKSAFVSQIDAYLKQNNKYKKSDAKITFADIEDCLLIVTSSFSTQTSYENQTKKAITNKFIQDAMTEFFKHQLEVYFIENPMEAEKIATQVMINKQSREAADKHRLATKTKLATTLDISNRIESLADCRFHDPNASELYIVEGKSALGSCKTARNADFQAIIPVRGKILNCLKAEYDKIFKSDIIVDILKVLGCGVEVSHKANKELNSFDLDKLRWNKIIICTDADVDGYQIRTLILTLFFRLTPTLIEKGYIYIAESPLFEITCKGETYFAYTEKEKAEITEGFGNAKYTIQRSKGLGENDAEMMSLTTMNPATRRLIKVNPDDASRVAEKFDLLLGDNLAGRKDYIATHGSEYLDMLDLS